MPQKRRRKEKAGIKAGKTRRNTMDKTENN